MSQPVGLLDIRVFGVVKEKLRKIQQTQTIPDDTSRYELIYNTMKSIWNDINNKVFEEAWEIPGLELSSEYEYEEISDSAENISYGDDPTFQPTESDSDSDY